MRNLLICLLAAVVLLVYGCKSSPPPNPESQLAAQCNDTRQAIKSVIKDPQRCQPMLAVVDAWESQAKAIIANVAAQRKQIAAGEANYDTSRTQLQEMYDKLDAQLNQLCSDAKQNSLLLRTKCSETEWDAIYAHRKPGNLNLF